MSNNNELYGYVDKNGEFVIEPQFEVAGSLNDGIAMVKQDGKWGLINLKGAYILNPIYDHIGARTTFGVWVSINQSWRLIDYYGHFITDQRYDFDTMELYQEGLIAVTIYEKVGFMDEVGNMVIRPQFESVLDGFSEGLAAVRLALEDDWYFINRKGEPIIQGEYESVQSFAEGLACVKVGGLWGYINKQGDYVIEPIFKAADSFCEGLAAVKINNKYGYIDRVGNWIIQPIYDFAYSFDQGHAIVKIDNKVGVIDKLGAVVIEPHFDDINFFEEGVAVVRDSGKYGVIDTLGNQIIPYQFNFAYGFSEGLMSVAIDKSIIEPKCVYEEGEKEIKRQSGLMEISNISFGHILKREGYEVKLDNIVCAFLEREDKLLSNFQGKGIISILIKTYSEDMGLLETEHICRRIYKYLDEDAQVEVVTDYEENEMLKDYFGITLVEI